MTATEDFLADDDDAKFIAAHLSDEMKSKFEISDIVYIVGLIYEYYEKIDLFTDEDTQDVLIDEDEVAAFVLNCLKEDGISRFSRDEIAEIVEWEFRYCEAIGIFSEEKD